MSKTAKWILGLGIGLVILTVCVVGGLVTTSLWGNTGWHMDNRSGWLWRDDTSTPWNNNSDNGDQSQLNPWQYMPGQNSPWHMLPRGSFPRSEMPGFGSVFPFIGMRGVHFGFFSPFRLLALPLLCLGFLALLILGVVLLARNNRQSQKTVAVQPMPAQVVEPAAEAPAAVVSEPETPAPAPESRVCPGCGRQAEADWGHCPYCGSPLT